MWPDGIVLTSPGFYQNLGFLQRIKALAIEKLIAKAGVETFNIAVLPRTARRYIGRLSTDGSNPCLHRLGDEHSGKLGRTGASAIGVAWFAGG